MASVTLSERQAVTGLADKLLATYRARTERSAALHASARKVMPGGDTRTVAFFAPYPVALTDGQGPVVHDADGNAYLDFLNNYTALIHGHAYGPIIDAVSSQLARGTAFPAPNAAQTELACLLTDRVASVELVRFCNSGTEAVMNAIRAARAFTGRQLLVKMEGGYHGTYDDVEVSVHPAPDSDVAGPEDAPVSVLDTPGVPASTVHDVIVVPLNDIAASERVFAAYGDEIAAVIIEPVMGSAGCLPAERDFLEALRALTIEHGALLIFDEVMSFRLGAGGYQEHVRVRPDLTTFAKIIGGGFPVGAFGGRAAVMAQFDPTRPAPLWQSGTFNGNVVTMVAGNAAMRAYGADAVAHVNALGERLRAGLGTVLASRSVAGCVTGYGSMVSVHLGPSAVRSYRDAARSSSDRKRLLHLALLNEGVFCAPRLMWCTSTVMTTETVDDAIGRFDRAVAAIAEALPTAP